MGITTPTSSTTSKNSVVDTYLSTETIPIPDPDDYYQDSYNANTRLSLRGNVIAQGFKIPISTDTSNPRQKPSIITSVDLWFSEVDTRVGQNIVSVEIREMVNGYPGSYDKAIGESVAVGLTSSEAVTYPSSSNGVNFKMKAPIKILPEKEYAIVVNSNSNKTKLFLAIRGEELANGNGVHSKPNSVGNSKGSLFVSENLTSWKAFLNTDLTFRVNRARFGNTTGTMTLKNKTQTSGVFNADIGAYSEGLAIETFENSYYVKVIHPNHGLNFDGANVHITGLDSDARYNNILGSEINGTHSVEYATLDSYFIRCTTEADVSGKPPIPKFTTFANQSLVYDSIMTQIPIIKDETDFINVSITPTNTNSVVFRTNADKIENTDLAVPTVASAETIMLNDIHDFENPMIVRDGYNATQNDLIVNLEINNGDDYCAPYFKTATGGLDPIVFRNIVGKSLIDSDLDALTVTSVTASDTLDNNQKLASYHAALQSITENSVYVTKQIDLQLPAEGFTIFFEADMEPSSSIELSYKARQIGDDTPFEELEWADFPYTEQINEDNYGVFPSTTDVKSYEVRTEVPYEFSSFKIRVRMRTENSAQIPTIYNFRVISDL